MTVTQRNGGLYGPDEQPAGGLRVRLAIDASDLCPVAAATDDGEADVGSVTWSRAGDREDVVEEFEIVGGEPESLPEDATTVFGGGAARRVRFSRAENDCFCDVVESHGLPVTDVTAERGTLSLTFHAPDVPTVRSVVGDLKEMTDSVRIEKLARTADGDSGGGDDFVLVDRGRLTERQVEVLETALSMGYFDRPRQANATEVAEALDISLSTFTEHLASAQSKILSSLLDESA